MKVVFPLATLTGEQNYRAISSERTSYIRPNMSETWYRGKAVEERNNLVQGSEEGECHGPLQEPCSLIAGGHDRRGPYNCFGSLA